MDVPVEYLEQIRLAYPDNRVVTATLNREGLVNDVVIINDELVFRFPKHEWAAQALSHEARILDIAGNPVEIPLPRFEFLSSQMAAYRLLRGEALTRDLLLFFSSHDREEVLTSLGLFLSTLHDIPESELTGVRTSDAMRSQEEWLSFAERVEAKLFPDLMQYQRALVVNRFYHVRSGGLNLEFEPALIHADLAPYHLLFDPETRRLAGVIDFGTGGIGDPAVDIACLLCQYGESVVRQLAPYYPKLEPCIDRARFWAGTLELQCALAGIENNDRSLFIAHIGSARDTRPIGSSVD